MEALDIIYLTLVGIAVIAGTLFALWMIYHIRKQSIKRFKQRQYINHKRIKYGRNN